MKFAAWFVLFTSCITLFLPSAAEPVLSSERIAQHAKVIAQRADRRHIMRMVALSAAGAFVAYRVYAFFAPEHSVQQPSLSPAEIERLKELAQAAQQNPITPSLAMRLAGWTSKVGSLIATQGALSFSMLMLNDLYGNMKSSLIVSASAQRFAQDETYVMQFLRELARIIEHDKDVLRSEARNNAGMLVWYEIEKILGYCDMCIARRKADSLLFDRLCFYRDEIARETENLATILASASLADIFAFERSLETLLSTFSVIEKIS